MESVFDTSEALNTFDFLNLIEHSTELLTEPPVKEEIFSIERLEQYAVSLARELKTDPTLKKGRSLVPSLRQNAVELLDAYLSLTHTVRNKRAIAPAGKWFVENFHIVEDHLRDIKRDLPSDYYDELPKLSSGKIAGYPRVYAIALAILSHTDSRLDVEILKRFLQAYQTVTPLSIGELWAIAITLRIALVKHLTPLALRVVSARKKREDADQLADQLLDLAMNPKAESQDLVALLERELGKPEKFDRAFVVQLAQQLRDQDPDVWPAFNWIEKQLNQFQTNLSEVIQVEHHKQAASQVTVGNLISSMRFLSSIDWRDFFESISQVDRILDHDPAQVYSKMDFSTRDSYRHAIERISKGSLKTEGDVSRKVVELANARLLDVSGGLPLKYAHIGYYLIGEGVLKFEAELGYRARLTERLARFVLKHATFFYISAISVLTLSLFYFPLKIFLNAGGSPWRFLWFSGIAIFPISEFALATVNYYITTFKKPKLLPKINLEKGIPVDEKAMVVIPTLFTDEATVREMVERLEVHFLGNQDEHIYFALLGDLGDNDKEHHPNDLSILEAATLGIEALNHKYSIKGEKRFYLFHRPRQWNESEEKWIGWERKRGKLHEFNRLLRGSKETSYFSHQANPELLLQIKYVITVDSDTQMPRNGAHHLIGTITHPLNRPVLNSEGNQVIQGYGILQPRIRVGLLSATRSHFSHVFSGNTGLDPYTTAVSDVYQDLFAEGSFTGKGLYVVDTFEMTLASRGPENSVLSHDLFEGSFARSALVTDVEFFDDYPSDYDAFLKRQHRWTRGDWQLAQWLFPKVPDVNGNLVPNSLSLISRFKIFDNLRRSLVPPATFLWFLLSWTVLPGSAVYWTGLQIFLMSFPAYAPLLSGRCFRLNELSVKEHVRSGMIDLSVKMEQVVLLCAFLASYAWNQVDAILRTLYRKLVSKKKLLEWVTFAQIATLRKEALSLLEMLEPSPLLALYVSALVFYFNKSALPVAAPFLLSWLASPLLKRVLSQRKKRMVPLCNEEVQTFRKYARHTWHYFETFVTEADHWLAPDNFQVDPKPIVAHRTSPTNIGLQLLSTAAAYDFGYVGLLEFIERTEKVFGSLKKMRTFRGHFFNWYDTLNLEPLRPEYISTVDSGNLAGHLLTLKQFCLEQTRKEKTNPHFRQGLEDTLNLILSEASSKDEGSDFGKVPSPLPSTLISLSHFRDDIRSALNLVESSGEIETRLNKAMIDSLLENLLRAEDILNALSLEHGKAKFESLAEWLNASLHQTYQFERDHSDVKFDDSVARLNHLADLCESTADSMQFKFLFDEQRKIFVIGYSVTDGRLDNSYYDLLASEARLASFIAIAKGEIPEEHWFRLGRQMTSVNGSRALIAWTATMFEYLMPLLVMKRFDDTLLDQTYKSIVSRQIEYGIQKQVPWGISEAGYNARDLNLNYQYAPFGVPGLGLKRGLSDDLVISPYSTFLAGMVDPSSALVNLKTFEKNGVLSKYGFFESIDYTPERLPKNQKSFILRSFMAHHQGMSLISIDNLLHEQVMQERFHKEPIVKATELLLQERIPHAVVLSCPRAEEVTETTLTGNAQLPRVYTNVNLPTPRIQILSNGNYSVMISSAGSGYSRKGDLAISRWREDWTRDHTGQFFYIKNLKTSKVWSSTYQPTLTEPDFYEATFSEDKVDFWRSDDEILTHTEVIVSPEDNVEMRRISLTNRTSESCELEVTSFLEVVLAKQRDDLAHPAFSNLFVETEFLLKENALLASRRRRSQTENEIWGFHVVSSEGGQLSPTQYETDRSRFIGRGRNTSCPIALSDDRPLSQTTGAVLDPIFSLRQHVRMRPNETVRLIYATGIASTREEALRQADKYRDLPIFTRESGIAWTQSQVQLRHLNISIEKAHVFQRLAGRIIYSDPSLRPRSHLLAANVKTQSSLWAYGISGDLPIILTRIKDEKDMAMVRELLHAHEYLRLKGLITDLVILNEKAPSYFQSLQEELQRQIRMSGSQALLDKSGGVFIRRTDVMPNEDVVLLNAIARVNLKAEKGTLEEQLERKATETELSQKLSGSSSKKEMTKNILSLPQLQFFNGLGGFEKDGKNYVIFLKEGQNTPAPWINVIANATDFGTQVSESGSGYTWSVNSRENRLTSWSNDAVSDPSSEAIYIRDEETGKLWSPTPLPIREADPYLIRHSQGYSEFQHNSHGIEQTLLVFVAVHDNIKISKLTLKNASKEKRELSVTHFIEWVLGFEKSFSTPSVYTESDDKTGVLFALNPFHNEFSGRVAFADMNESERNYTCDREEFLGRNGNTASPAALSRISLSQRTGAGLDPCAVLQKKFSLAPGEEKEFVFTLGETENREKSVSLALNFRDMKTVNAAFAEVKQYWDELLGRVVVKTPNPALDILVNYWLPYQTLSCRVWARSAFYQSGGAYGFRDQLQDVMALIYSKPEIAKAQILRAAERQFPEGDVQHWWHPPTGRGVRTRCSDDLIWLPHTVSIYLEQTRDESILAETIFFIEAPHLEQGADDAYTQPFKSAEKASLYEHCVRALDRSLKVGKHRLPLIGSGDWNDGMNRVGNEGEGESVWVAWFLYKTLKDFLPICEKMGDAARISKYKEHLVNLKTALEENAWDGKWYKRAFFGDGSPLGSSVNQECKIDSIAQSWAVLSEAGDADRSKQAMESVKEFLIFKNEKIIKLFTPPFDQGATDPGYIKGYLPGVRENGGQYTHAAVWTLMAFAALGDGDQATELYDLLNPIHHSSTLKGLYEYKVEPYVIAADIYGQAPHVGRGGWTWYTGSASLMYRAAVESILGFELKGDQIEIHPCIPKNWTGFEITYTQDSTRQHFTIQQDASGIKKLTIKNSKV